MKLVSLQVEGYRQFLRPVAINFPDGLIGICGPNGAGKTKLIEAIGYALFGYRGMVRDGDTLADLNSKAGPPGTHAAVELTFTVRGQTYRIERSKRKVGIYLEGDGSPQASGQSGVTSYVQKLLGLTPTTYHGTFVARQREVAGLQAASPDQRKQLINQLIGVAQVEEAIRLAKEETRERRRGLEIAQAGVPLAVDTAQTAYDKAVQVRDHLDAQVTVFERIFRSQEARRTELDTAVKSLQERQTQAEGLGESLAELARHIATLESQRSSAELELQQIARYARALDKMQQELNRTATAAQAVVHHERHRKVAEQQVVLGEVQAELKGQLATQGQHRRRIQARIAACDRHLTETQDARTAEREKRAAAAATAAAEQTKLNELSKQRTNALSLGEAGRCPWCGGQLEDRLTSVLEHLAEEVAAATANKERHDDRVKEADELIEQLSAREGRWLMAKRALEATLEDRFKDVPGRIKAAEQRVRELRQVINEEVSQLPDDLKSIGYDPDQHATVLAASEIHQRLQLVAVKYRQRIARRDQAEAEYNEAAEGLTDAAGRRQAMELSLKETVLKPGELSTAEAAAAEARKVEDDARTDWINAREQLAAVGEQVRQAADELSHATEAQTRVQRATYQLQVAEWTERLLGGLLDEISAEARPRLVELMYAWMRPLLGTRFRTIELTDDYRIKADNGSGLHEIGHFSGAEQTLLAIMLRAAVSLFCRERAGFDTGFLILDEVFGDQDSQHRNALVQFLEEVKDYYHQIFIVSHIDEVSGQLDSVLQVGFVGANESHARLLP